MKGYMLSYKIQSLGENGLEDLVYVQDNLVETSTPTLEDMQEVVGGYIETMVRVPSPTRKNVSLDGYVNEEGLLISLPVIMSVADRYGDRPFAGNIVFVAADERTGDTLPLTKDEAEYIRNSYSSLTGQFRLTAEENGEWDGDGGL